MKYSIIVPVYNGEQTLERCIRSILVQEYTDYEVILVNDGSRDRSPELCRKYAEEFDHIRYFKKKNGGVSSARNLGIDQARGEYLLFVDSDDYVVPAYLSVIDRAVEANHPDLLLFGADSTPQGRQWNTGSYTENTELGIAKRISEALHTHNFSGAVNKMYRRKIVDAYGLRMPTDLCIGEDQVFLFRYALHAETMVSLTDSLYTFDISDTDSLSRKKREYLTEQMLLENRMLYDGYRQIQFQKKAQKYYEKMLSWAAYRSAYTCIKEVMKFDYSTDQRKKEIDKICRQFSGERIRPHGLSSWLLAAPIRMHMSGLLNWSMGKITGQG